MADYRRIKKLFFMALCSAGVASLSLFMFADSCFPAMMHQMMGGTRKNGYGGYDFFSATGRKTGYSKPNRHGGFDYYDGQGNMIGRIKRKSGSRSIYTYYDSEGIKRGVLKKRASGIYYFTDVHSGRMIDSIPAVGSDLGSLSPGIFTGNR